MQYCIHYQLMKSMSKRIRLINWWMELALHLGKVSSSGDTGLTEGEGQGGFSPPTFLEISKSYREKDVFSPPPHPPHFQSSSAGPVINFTC